MKTFNMLKRLLFILSFICLLLLPAAQGDVLIPDGRLATNQWMNYCGVQGYPRGGVPERTNYVTLGTTATVQQVQAAINAAPSNSYIQLLSGTYAFAVSLYFNGNDGVELRGDTNSWPPTTIFAPTDNSGSDGYINIYNPYHQSLADAEIHAPDWTAGYTRGTTNITVSSTTGLEVGDIVILDQLNDDVNVATGNGTEGLCGTCDMDVSGTHVMQQHAEVLAINGTTVTITPPIFATNWQSGLSPRMLFQSDQSGGHYNGLRSLWITTTNDAHTHSTGWKQVSARTVKDFYVKDCVIQNSPFHGIKLTDLLRFTITGTTFTSNTTHNSQCYSIAGFQVGSGLVYDNIFSPYTSGFNTAGGCEGNVSAYNYMTNSQFEANYPPVPPIASSFGFHGGFAQYILIEGNWVQKIDADNIHGTSGLNTILRNVSSGWQINISNNAFPIEISSSNHSYNVIGNILGHAGYQDTYEHDGIGDTGTKPIWLLVGGWANNDSGVKNTLIRLGNYNTFNGAIPAAETLTNALPNSYWLSAKPDWFGNLTWPPYNPSNTSAAETSPTNIPAGYRAIYGANPASGTNLPSISSHPTGTTNSNDGGFLLTVIANGGTLAYQWRTNGLNVSGATASTYGSTPAVTNQSGDYTVVITNAYGSVTSTVATVLITNIPPTAPSITVQPVGKTNSTATGFTLNVTAAGSPTLYYQWNTNTVSIAGATSSSYIKVPATTNQSADYTVVITNVNGSITSSIAKVSITNASNLVLAFGFEEGSGTTVIDLSGYSNNGVNSGATYTSGKFGYSLYFPTNLGTTMVTVPYSTSIDWFTNGGITLEAWVYPMMSRSAWSTILFHGNETAGHVEYIINGTTTTSGRPSFWILNTAQYLNDVFAVSNWTHIAATYDLTNRIVYTNGVIASSNAATGNMESDLGYDLTIGGNVFFPLEVWGGKIDEVRIYNRALTVGEIQTDMTFPIQVNSGGSGIGPVFIGTLRITR